MLQSLWVHINSNPIECRKLIFLVSSIPIVLYNFLSLLSHSLKLRITGFLVIWNLSRFNLYICSPTLQGKLLWLWLNKALIYQYSRMSLKIILLVSLLRRKLYLFFSKVFDYLVSISWAPEQVKYGFHLMGWVLKCNNIDFGYSHNFWATSVPANYILYMQIIYAVR